MVEVRAGVSTDGDNPESYPTTLCSKLAERPSGSLGDPVVVQCGHETLDHSQFRTSLLCGDTVMTMMYLIILMIGSILFGFAPLLLGEDSNLPRIAFMVALRAVLFFVIFAATMHVKNEMRRRKRESK